jgi:hypothetical protein
MTVSSTTIKQVYTGSTGTIFPYTFGVYDDSELQVIKRASTGIESILSLAGGDYTVSGAGGAGGNVTLASALDLTDTLVIKSDIAMLQTLDYIDGGPFPAESHEKGLDKLTKIALQLAEQFDRTFKTSISDITTTSWEVPEPRDGYALGWNGTELANLAMPGTLVVSTFGQNLLSSVSAAAARSFIDAVGTTDPFELKGWGSDPLYPATAADDGSGATLSDSVETWVINSFGAPSGYSFGYVFEGYAPYGVSGTLTAALDGSETWNLPVQTYTTATTYTTNELAHLINASGNLIADGRYGRFSAAGLTLTTIPTFPTTIGATVSCGTTAEITVMGGGWDQFASTTVGVSSGTTYALTFSSTQTSLGYFVDRRLRLRVQSTVGAVLTGCKVTPS